MGKFWIQLKLWQLFIVSVILSLNSLSLPTQLKRTEYYLVDLPQLYSVAKNIDDLSMAPGKNVLKLTNGQTDKPTENSADKPTENSADKPTENSA